MATAVQMDGTSMKRVQPAAEATVFRAETKYYYEQVMGREILL